MARYRRRLAGAALLALLASLWPLGGARAGDTVQSLYAAAKQEGKVVNLSAGDNAALTALGAKFTARYPGVAVENFRIEPAPSIERVITESQAGKVTVDVLDTNMAYLPQLFQRDLVEPYPWSQVFGIPLARVLFGKVLVEHNLDMPIVYNTNAVKPGDITSWDDLLDAKWRGKVLLEARGTAFALLAQQWGTDKAFGYLRRLLANQPIIIKGGTPTIEALSGGQGAVAVGTYGGHAIQYRDEGAPVDWARVGPIPAMNWVILPIKGAPHPNAARLWTAWMVTPEAQAILYATLHFGMIGGDTPSPHGKDIMENKLDVVLESTDIARNQQLLAQAGKIIGGLQ